MQYKFNPFSGKLDAVQNISGLVPYTGATTDVNLGVKDIYGANVNRNEGLITEPTITDATGIAIALTSCTCLIRSSSTWDSDGRLYYKVISANNALSVTDNSINYIYVTWNSGTPIYAATTNRALLNNSDAVPVARVYMSSGSIEYQLLYGAVGKSAAIRNFDRVMRTRGTGGIEREPGGLGLSETATRVVNIAAGYAWFGVNRVQLDAVAQGGSGVTSHLWYHSSGVWTVGTITAYNNTQYDNGTNLATLTANRYAVNWVFRNIVTKEIDIVLGRGDYTLAQSESSTIPTLPDAITNFYVLIGRIIVQKSSDTATSIESSTSATFNQSAVSTHNDLGGLQGGTSGEYYHLTSAEATDLTDGGETTLHSHAGGGISDGWEKIYDEAVATSAVTTIDISGLNLDTAKTYKIELQLKNATTTTCNIILWVNGDYTHSNYYRQYWSVSGDGAGQGAYNNNYGPTFSTASPLISTITMSRPAQDKAVWISQSAFGNTNAAGENQVGIMNNYFVCKNAANVTSIRIESTEASAIAIGSRVMIFKATA
jgi:hypothetical protein